jgi:hypothetical protein
MGTSKIFNTLTVACHGLETLTMKGLAFFFTSFLIAIKEVDEFLLLCLDFDVTVRHNPNLSTCFNKIEFNYQLLFDKRNDESIHNILLYYLEKGRHAIFTADFSNNDFMVKLLRIITDLSVEIDDKIKFQLELFDRDSYDNKIINRVKLAKVIETVTHIKDISTNKITLTFFDYHIEYNVVSYVKLFALDLLGGKFNDDKPVTGNFILSKIPFSNIEKKSVFSLDKTPVPVFIVDKKWISKFNAGEVKLAKNDRFKVLAIAERSPLSNKYVVYYFIEIKGINI